MKSVSEPYLLSVTPAHILKANLSFCSSCHVISGHGIIESKLGFDHPLHNPEMESQTPHFPPQEEKPQVIDKSE